MRLPIEHAFDETTQRACDDLLLRALKRLHHIAPSAIVQLFGSVALDVDSTTGHTEWKLLMHPDRSRLELYNLSASVFESDNVASAFPQVVASLSAKLLAWEASMPAAKGVQLNAGCVPHATGSAGGTEAVVVDERTRAEFATLSPYELA